jgi:uncharacterized membrane protein
MKTFLKNFMMFCVGFTLYQCVEGLWKTLGPNHLGIQSFTMGILGGITILMVSAINKKLPWLLPIWLQAIIGGIGILILEFGAGLLLNKYLCPLLGRPIIWDYTGMPLNIMGIICPQFFIIWVFFAACYIVIDDYLRWIMYDEEKPHYSWWW